MMQPNAFPSANSIIDSLAGSTGKIIAILFTVLFLFFGCFKAISSPAGDFANYYTASRLAITGAIGSVKLYDHYDFQLHLQQYFHGTLGSFIPFPPSTVLVMMPFALLPPNAAKVAFLIINVAGILALIRLLHRSTGLSFTLIAVLVLLNGLSLWSDTREGQVYLLLALLIVAALYLEDRNWNITSGILLGLAFPIKYFTALFILYFLFRKNFRLIAGAILGASVVIVAGLLITGMKVNEYYLTTILPQHLAGNIQDPFSVNFQSFSSLFNRLFVQNESLNAHPLVNSSFLAVWLKSFVSLTCLAILVCAFLMTRNIGDRQKVWYGASLLTLFGLVTSPAAASYHYVLLVIPMVLLVVLSRSNLDGTGLEFLERRSGLFLAVYVAVNLFPFYWLYRFKPGSLFQLLAYSKLVLLTLFFLFAVPPDVIKGKSIRTILPAAALLALALLVVFPTQSVESDGAVWVPVSGLIISDFSFQDGSMYYYRESPTGFVAMKNGFVTSEKLPISRRTSVDGAFTVFDSTIANYSQVFVRNNRNGFVVQLTRVNARNSDPTWSPDDSRIYFLSDRGRGIDCTAVFFIDVNGRIER